MRTADVAAGLKVLTSDLVTERTAESHADVAGLNYAEQRDLSDDRWLPHRVVLGTETSQPAGTSTSSGSWGWTALQSTL
ncbi:hypothetical protein GCM10009841_19630 [Microlunatus panaciterrae]